MDKKVTRAEFLEIYKKALDEMFASDTDDNDIYGKEVTVHWNGIYCSVEDGATAYNTVISAIEDAMDELDAEPERLDQVRVEYITEDDYKKYINNPYDAPKHSMVYKNYAINVYGAIDKCRDENKGCKILSAGYVTD